jgi:uncharacterized protein (DUF433 family)
MLVVPSAVSKPTAALELVAEKPPLVEDEGGVVRVGGTRVRLDTVIYAFQNGCTPEEILLKYPSLKLPDIYAVITYFLLHREEIDAYLNRRQILVKDAEQEIEARFPSAGVRERLLARRVL